MFKFFEKAYFETSNEVKDDLENRNRGLIEESTSRVFSDIDLTKFKEGTDIKRVINIVLWSLASLGEEETKKAKRLGKELDYVNLFAEADEYIKVFKNNFYK